MEASFSPAEIAATRKLLGITADQLGQILGINPRSIRRWETGGQNISAGPAGALLGLREKHDLDVATLLEAAEEGIPISIPTGDSEYPASWWLAVAARVIDRFPNAILEWH